MIKPSGETVLLYNINEDKIRKLKILMITMGMRVRVVQKDEYQLPVGYLAGIKDIALENLESECSDFQDEMMVMRGFTSKRLDLFLQNMRKQGIDRIDYKAILTPTNARWNSWQLYQELKREHEEMHQIDK